MLLGIRIINFALVDRLEIEFGSGLSVLTGETGAGKSIILDAIDVALGGKVNSRMIRSGVSQGIIEATFQTNSNLEGWLREQEIEPFEDGTVICARELSRARGTFRSRCRVNGVIFNRQAIAQLRDRLLEITAQGQTAQITLPIVQRELLDAYGGSPLIEQGKLVATAYETSQKIKQDLDSRRQSERQRLQRLDLLEYQIKELEAARLEDDGELEELSGERDRLSHVVELQQLSYQVYQLLYQDDGEENAAADILGRGESLLNSMVNYDRQLEPILEMVRGAMEQIVEAGQQIYSYGESLEGDPARLEEVEARIKTLKGICRKYGPDLADAIAHYQSLRRELEELSDRGRSLDELERDYAASQGKLTEACQKLTELRKGAAIKLERQLLEQLKPLAMDKVIFECRMTPSPPTINGADRVEYYFSPNPGEKLQPLSSTASGGEMSRFLLALKACLSQGAAGAKTLIFDEIDAGVSGKVAQAIAEKLHQLSHHHQVLCVTHQPLIAAMADHHFRVEKHLIEELNLESLSPEDKQISDLRTVVRVKILDNQHRRRDELAELTGGNAASDAIAFANSLLETAASHKQTKN